MSDQPAVDAPTIGDCIRLLTRIAVPPGQKQLYQALVAAGPKGATTQELVSTMGRRDEKDLTGVLGALGHRVNGTPGYGATHKPGILMILQIDEAEQGWRYRLKPVMRDALAVHAPSWLPNHATLKAMRLVAFVRSRFPGWQDFEDPRFNGGQLDEVGYKLATRKKARRILSKEALSELLAVGDTDAIVDRLLLIGSDNNLLFQPKSQIGDLGLLHHDGLDRGGFCRAFIDLLHGEGDTPARIDRYGDWLSSQDIDSMNRWTFPTYFLFFLDAKNEILVKPRATKKLLKLGGWDIQFGSKPTGDDYARIRDAYRELREGLAAYGPRHMIDLQSFGWVAQEEAERQNRARTNARSEGFDLDPRVEAAMAEFERSADVDYLVNQAERIDKARERFNRDFGSEKKVLALGAETFVDFMNDVDAHGGAKGLFSTNVVFSKNSETKAFQNLQQDLPTLRAALAKLLHGDGTVADRIDAMWDGGSDVKNYVTDNLTVPSALLFVQDPSQRSGVLPMSMKQEKLIATDYMPALPETATLGERFHTFEQALTELPQRYGRQWAPEARKEFYFNPAFRHHLENGGAVPPNGDSGGFEALIGSLKEGELHFSSEAVANYVLALQTKRFAILTGISGTGKTRIAREVARHFRPLIESRVAEIPEDASEITVVRTNIKHGVVQLPVAIGSILRLPPMSDAARGRIRVSYPKGDIELAFREHPQPGYVRLHPRGAFREWFNANLKPGDSYWIRVLEDEEQDHDRLQIGLPDTEVVTERRENCAVVPVRPDWVDNRGLLGYFNPLTNEYSTTPFLSLLLEAQEEEVRAEREERDPRPFFTVLDEMNLARVEHYFSDFLSALESGEAIPLHDSQEIEDGDTESGTRIPQNLRVPDNVFFTGTVNVDETTYMFSPKVLDRAFTIEFDRVDLEGYAAGEGDEERSGLDLSADDEGLHLKPYTKPGRDDWLRFTALAGGRFYKTLLELHGILEREHRHFGYRVANEIARFVNLARQQATDSDAATKAAFDLALLQKVLPKFHGTQQELEDLLTRLFDFAVYGRDRGRRRSEAVKLDGWSVVEGHLTPKPEGEPTPEADTREDELSDGSVPDARGASESDNGAAEKADAESGLDEATDTRGIGRTPAFPRTAGKIWRMLWRLEQRGFTSFIE